MGNYYTEQERCENNMDSAFNEVIRFMSARRFADAAKSYDCFDKGYDMSPDFDVIENRDDYKELENILRSRKSRYTKDISNKLLSSIESTKNIDEINGLLMFPFPVLSDRMKSKLEEKKLFLEKGGILTESGQIPTGKLSDRMDTFNNNSSDSISVQEVKPSGSDMLDDLFGSRNTGSGPIVTIKEETQQVSQTEDEKEDAFSDIFKKDLSAGFNSSFSSEVHEVNQEINNKVEQNAGSTAVQNTKSNFGPRNSDDLMRSRNEVGYVSSSNQDYNGKVREAIEIGTGVIGHQIIILCHPDIVYDVKNKKIDCMGKKSLIERTVELVKSCSENGMLTDGWIAEIIDQLVECYYDTTSFGMDVHLNHVSGTNMIVTTVSPKRSIPTVDDNTKPYTPKKYERQAAETPMDKAVNFLGKLFGGRK